MSETEHDLHDRDRDNTSGRFVSDAYAAQNPASTTSESTLAKGGSAKAYRDDATGKFVSEEYAKQHPDTTHEDRV